VGLAVMGERHTADEMAKYALDRFSADRSTRA
jgi:hypothetical protein